MPNLNNAQFMGHLTADPEVKTTQSGNFVCEFTIACNRKVRDMEEVFFANCKVWGKSAENLAKFTRKGSCVYAEGYLRQEEWEDRNTGAKRSKVVCICDAVQFIDRINSGNGGNNRTGNRTYSREDAQMPH